MFRGRRRQVLHAWVGYSSRPYCLELLTISSTRMGARVKPHNQEVAEGFLADDRYKKNLLYCRSWDTFFLYANGWYGQVDSRSMDYLIWEFSKNKYEALNLTAALVRDIVTQIKWMAPRQMEEITTPYIALNDVLVNMDTFEFEPFDRDRVAIHHIDCDSDKLNMPIPKFTAFLQTTLVTDDIKTDQELLTLVQEMFGYYLLNNLHAQVVFFLVGQGANGKSVMLHILEQMIGTHFVSAMSIQTLTLNQFATSGLIGKKVNICNEEESKYLRSDKFKALISGDLIQAERKYEGQFTFRPRTKYIFASNQMPTFDGINHGIRRRMMIVPFKRIFKPEEQRKTLVAELTTEVPGILQWALIGAKRLVKQNYQFSKSLAAAQSAEEFENYTSSAIMFFREGYVHDIDGFMDNEDIYKEYQDWCSRTGKRPLSMTHFNRDLRDNLGVKQKTKWSTAKNKTVRGHCVSMRYDDPPPVELTFESITKTFHEDDPKPQQETLL